jgi:ABC-type multidrug transport system fused ATPase/permease subunit
MLKNPPVVVLDEATSALDSATEAAIQGALEKLGSGRTQLVVAHRLSTIAGAAQILVLDGGRLTESGTHAQLLDKGGLYRRLWDTQQEAAMQAAQLDAAAPLPEPTPVIH